jgi:hypothetical protein
LLVCVALLPAPAADDKAQPLPPEVIRAWIDAGTATGWTRERFGIHLFHATRKRPADALPVFRLQSWKQGAIAKLPDPAVPFGLDLSRPSTPVTDATVKELSHLKHLHWLHLESTHLTDAGARSLGELKELRHLFLASTDLTDAGIERSGISDLGIWVGLATQIGDLMRRFFLL